MSAGDDIERVKEALAAHGSALMCREPDTPVMRNERKAALAALDRLQGRLAELEAGLRNGIAYCENAGPVLPGSLKEELIANLRAALESRP